MTHEIYRYFFLGFPRLLRNLRPRTGRAERSGFDIRRSRRKFGDAIGLAKHRSDDGKLNQSKPERKRHIDVRR